MVWWKSSSEVTINFTFLIHVKPQINIDKLSLFIYGFSATHFMKNLLIKSKPAVYFFTFHISSNFYLILTNCFFG
jgi:hypothetical protein